MFMEFHQNSYREYKLVNSSVSYVWVIDSAFETYSHKILEGYIQWFGKGEYKICLFHFIANGDVDKFDVIILSLRRVSLKSWATLLCVLITISQQIKGNFSIIVLFLISRLSAWQIIKNYYPGLCQELAYRIPTNVSYYLPWNFF